MVKFSSEACNASLPMHVSDDAMMGARGTDSDGRAYVSMGYYMPVRKNCSGPHHYSRFGRTRAQTSRQQRWRATHKQSKEQSRTWTPPKSIVCSTSWFILRIQRACLMGSRHLLLGRRTNLRPQALTLRLATRAIGRTKKG